MDEKLSDSALNKNLNEMQMPRVKEVANTSVASKSEVSVPAGNVRRENLKNMEEIEEEKNVNCKKSEDETDQKSKDDASQMTADENTNISEQKNLSGKLSEGKTATKRKFEDANVSETEIDANLKIVDENAENSEQDKNAGAENPKRKTAAHPPTSEMVLESLRSLRKRNGATAEEITKYIEENYQVNINRIKPHINRFLQKGVSDRLLEQKSGSGAKIKFKIKETGKNIKGTANAKKVARKIDKGAGKVKKISKPVKIDDDKAPKEEILSYFS